MESAEAGFDGHPERDSWPKAKPTERIGHHKNLGKFRNQEEAQGQD